MVKKKRKKKKKQELKDTLEQECVEITLRCTRFANEVDQVKL